MYIKQKSRAVRLAEQMRCPHGLLGILTSRMMRQYNSPAERWTVALLHPASDDDILEIGFGTGCGLEEALRFSPGGKVFGIDISHQMIRMAARSNRAAVAAGKLTLLRADCARLPFEDEAFDSVFAVNVLYFWADPRLVLSEIRRVLRPNGRVALYMIRKADLLRMEQARTDIFHLYEDGEVKQLLEDVGFLQGGVAVKNEGFRTGVCILGRK